MTPNPSYFLAFSSARKLLLGAYGFNFRATQSGRELLQPQTRGEALVAARGAFSTVLSA
jgi:hypothetical protein